MRVVVIGAGFGGIAVAAELRRRGVDDLVVLEARERVGGVWEANGYPGCACDVPAPLYSYSFALNPGWSRRYPPRAEIRDYLESVVDRLDLRRHLRLGTSVTGARWDGGQWVVSLEGGETVEADVLVPAVGQLSRPSLPAIAGIEDFAGQVVHSAGWSSDVHVDGRRVAVIGTGASAVQIVPEIVGRASALTVFQRTAPWTLPRAERHYGRLRRAVVTRAPSALLLGRAGTWVTTQVMGAAVLGNPVALAVLTGVSHAQRRVQVRDPALRAAVRPQIPFGCKRVLFTSGWYPALSHPSTTLVTSGIERITATGVRTVDGQEHPADLLVLSTGFTATDLLAPLAVTGRDGVALSEAWSGGAHAHLGMTVPGFPNLFVVYGPNTNTGNTSVVYFHEAQARYIGQAVSLLASRQGPLEVRPEVEAAYDEEVQSRLAGSVWTTCASWYRTASGRVVTNWPGTAGEYARRTRSLVLSDFRPPGRA